MHKAAWIKSRSGASFKLALLFVIEKVSPEESGKFRRLNRLRASHCVAMSGIVGLRVISQPRLLIFCISLRKRCDGKAAAKERGSEYDVPLKRADVLLLALVNGLQALDHCVNVIEGVLDLVVCIRGR